MRNPTATREWRYVCGSVGPICDSVQTLCYHYCAALWPHPHSNKAWEKTRTIIVADHPPDSVQCWDFANSVLPLVQVKWLNGETGQGSFIVYESVLEFLFVDFLDRLQPSPKITSDYVMSPFSAHSFFNSMVPIEEIIYCFCVYRRFRLFNLTVVYMFCILARWLSIAAASINYHVKAHITMSLHNNNHKGLTSTVLHYTHFQVFSSYPQIWWSSAATLLSQTLSRPPQNWGNAAF